MRSGFFYKKHPGAFIACSLSEIFRSLSESVTPHEPIRDLAGYCEPSTEPW